MDQAGPEAEQGLEERARRLAERLSVFSHPVRGPFLLHRTQEQAALLRSAYRYFHDKSAAEEAFSSAAEWLLDNFYLVERALRQVREDMPAGYYRRLPKLDQPPLARYPRIYALAQVLVGETQGRIAPGQIEAFTHAYQNAAPLTMGELWALPTMLRISLLDLLTRSLAGFIDRELSTDGTLEAVSAIAAGEPADEIVGACISSLRALDDQDWKQFFEAVSLVEVALNEDPSQSYPHMDFDTRDRYRGVVESLAQQMGLEEALVARQSIALAETAAGDGSSSRAAHVGYYLVDRGRPQLEAALGQRLPWRQRLGRWLLDQATVVYPAAIGLLGGLVVFGLLELALYLRATPWQCLGVVLLGLVPASIAALSLVNLIATHIVPPRVLPKLDFSEGIPASSHTMVVIPTLLTSTQEVDALLQQLELHFLGNAPPPDAPHLHLALLGDLADAAEEHLPEDEVLIQRAQEGTAALNRRHSQGAYQPFFFFCRRRQWNQREKCWMGWERKRGNLTEFNRLLQGTRQTSFAAQFGDLDILPHIQYVITLDADTMLPRDAAHRLVGTMAHPLNRAEFAPDSDTVVAGYTILQPRVEVKPTSANRSPFAQIYAGDVGLDLYTRAVSDLYQDLFGEGIYVGKGIYDVVAFRRSLSGKVPENALLSHDLFEGLQGRAGLVTDIVLYEDYPAGYLGYAQRRHRWVRGDWQLLPWLGARVPCADGKSAPNELSPLDRFKIIDNLRRSLVPPALLILLIAGWLWLPGPAWAWTLVGIGSAVVPILTASITGLLRGLRGGPLRTAVPSLRLEGARGLLSLAFLPYEALLMVDAIVTTLVRLYITHRRMLQWVPAAHSARLFAGERQAAMTWGRMGPASLLALAMAVVLGVLRPSTLLPAAPLLLAWLLAPQIALWLSRPPSHRPAALSGAQEQQLRRLARRTWLFFEQFAGPDDHWLPPDHFQEHPRGLTAHSTSPTNIGLLLIASLGAYDLGYINPLDLSLRLQSALESMDRLERYRGHLLNWYDTRTLSPLSPRYVSTVDSGNLAGCLLALCQGLQQLPQEDGLRWQRWQGLLDTLGVLREVLEGIDHRQTAAEIAGLQSHLDEIVRQIEAVRGTPERWADQILQLNGSGWEALHQALGRLIEAGAAVLDRATLHDLELWAERIRHHLRSQQEEVERWLPWTLSFARLPERLRTAPGDNALGQAWRDLREALPTMVRLDQAASVCQAGRDPLARLRRALEERLPGEEASTPLAGATPLQEQVGPTTMARTPGEDDAAAAVQEALSWCEELAQRLEAARKSIGEELERMNVLCARAETYLQETDFRFLFDAQRQIFCLGYDVDRERLDRNHYDYLASEARIASLVAIAKGDVPQQHWLHLSRAITEVDGVRALLSWNGSMFEYLMPPLLVRGYAHTLLDQTCRAVVHRQIAYARSRRVPWGISESGYYRFDAQMNYQYRGFGVPGLGRKRGLGDDLVIAPYASLLALSVAPDKVVENVDRLVAIGMRGPFGFYESVDYTPAHILPGQDRAIVRSYMAHHQGMIMAALTNLLADGAIVRRFHSDPRIQSIELLLQEQVPGQAPVEQARDEAIGLRRPARSDVRVEPWTVTADAPVPYAHALSNGRYTLVITAAGGGYSAFHPTEDDAEEPLMLTRWRADTTCDDWGTWIYIRDQESGALWSATAQPIASVPEQELVQFHTHMASFRRREQGISMHLDITVAIANNVEIRRLTLINQGTRTRRLALSSYGEVVLAPQSADRRHPAFNKLFVESEYLPQLNALLFRRRPRSAGASSPYLVHLLTVDGAEVVSAHESDRARFVGRGRTVHAPAALQHGLALSGTAGATLDPIMALGQEIELAPHGRVCLAYVTLAAGTRQGALDLAQSYRSFATIGRAFAQARSQAGQQLCYAGLDPANLQYYQQLLSALLYPHPALRASPETVAANTKGQAGLWPYAISGDYPILLVRVDHQEQLVLVHDLLQAHACWRRYRIPIDLVILNQHDVGYVRELQGLLHHLVDQMDAGNWLNCRGGVFLLQADQMDQADRALIEAAARVVLDSRAGSLADQLAPLRAQPSYLPAFQPTQSPPPEDTPPLRPPERPAPLRFDNGLGGFSADGREYVIYLEPGQWTPAPWINVIAYAGFGFLVSEAGAGCTWAENSGENRLTPWRNDPVSDMPGEALYLRDEETAAVWTPTPLPTPAAAPYLVRHGAGYTVFEHHSHGLKQQMSLFAPPDAPVKIVRLRLENTWNHVRRITATFYAEWVLGNDREITQGYIVPAYDAERRALLAHNPYDEPFARRVAFVAASKDIHGLTADRQEFLGRRGTLGRPAALGRIGLAGTVQAGRDPCAALQVHLDIAPGQAQEVVFLLGQGEDEEAARQLIERYRQPGQVEAAWEATQRFWDELLGTITVQTPDPALDLLLNRWLLYQALSCRIWGRSALYQSSGAFGFRDQLQDVMALVHAAPELVRAHILRSARHQFEQGDVLHWWHPPLNRGVRTRISDNLLWLPFVTAQYATATGDHAILSEEVPFLRGAPLASGEEERYDLYRPTPEAYSLYEHCCRALERGSTQGPHGLPLMGTGDWNDGLNRVGVQGKGESIWLGWFLYTNLVQFAPFCEEMGEPQRAESFRRQAAQLARALEEHGWDGAWYRRAYYDDGDPLGSAGNQEGQIFSLAQSWAVISGAAGRERAAQAMDALYERLVREKERLGLLFAPPFDKTPHSPGYIQGYPPGIRENGGQYTHGALWAVWALCRLGQGDRAGALLRLLNPIYHAETPEQAQRYRVEPYVIAADIYSAEQHLGRGGWTWYTGSAAWFYRLALEAILGFVREGRTLRIAPVIPAAWPGYALHYRFGRARYEIHVKNPEGVEQGVRRILLDGEPVDGEAIALADDGQVHRVEVEMGSSTLNATEKRNRSRW